MEPKSTTLPGQKGVALATLARCGQNFAAENSHNNTFTQCLCRFCGDKQPVAAVLLCNSKPQKLPPPVLLEISIGDLRSRRLGRIGSQGVMKRPAPQHTGHGEEGHCIKRLIRLRHTFRKAIKEDTRTCDQSNLVQRKVQRKTFLLCHPTRMSRAKPWSSHFGMFVATGNWKLPPQRESQTAEARRLTAGSTSSSKLSGTGARDRAAGERIQASSSWQL